MIKFVTPLLYYSNMDSESIFSIHKLVKYLPCLLCSAIGGVNSEHTI